MLLEDQVKLLRQNLVQLYTQEFVLPLMGGLEATRRTYQFKSLIHPARDIATAIVKADPGGNKLPNHLRGWNLDVADGFGTPYKIRLDKLLSRIIHVYYLRIGGGDIDISNDRGERVTLPYSALIKTVQRLELTPEDICLVICGLAEKEIKNKDAGWLSAGERLGEGNLRHCCLATIKRWPILQENIWKTFFVDQVTIVKRDCQTVNNEPFIMGSKCTETTAIWHIGWRRGDIYAESWIDVLRLIGMIQEYFHNNMYQQEQPCPPPK